MSDPYKPPDFDDPAAGPFSKWAFLSVPQFRQRGDGSWTAWPAGDDASRVTAATKDEAIAALGEAARAREDRQAHDAAIFATHLVKPITGIYAMPIETFLRLRETESVSDINTIAFPDAELYRQTGRRFSVADYFTKKSLGERTSP
jgi:hypothetical protein